MKKATSRIISFAIAAVLLCAMTTAAFAASFSGRVLFTHLGASYEAKYSQQVNATSSSVSASLQIDSSYQGPAWSGMTFISINGFGITDDGTIKSLASGYDGGITECYAGGTNTTKYKILYALCEATIGGTDLPQRQVPAGG